MTKKNTPTTTITVLFDTISHIIEEAKNTVYRTANFTMVQAYWNIGKTIVEEEQNGKERAEYGQELIKQLSKKLIPLRWICNPAELNNNFPTFEMSTLVTSM
jgi:hypothetical protein